MSVGHLVHVLLTVYNDTEHVTQKSPGPICGWVKLVGSCVPIHACQSLPDPKCLFDPSGLSLCLPGDHFRTIAVDDMVLFHSMVSDGRVLLLSLALEAWVCVPAVKETTSFRCSFILRPSFLPVSPWRTGAVLARDPVDQLDFLLIFDLFVLCRVDVLVHFSQTSSNVMRNWCWYVAQPSPSWRC